MFSIQDVELVAEIIANSKYLVGYTGAGVSTESGLPDYRGPEGVWTLRDKGLKPKLPRQPISEIEPNAGHFAFVDLYELGILKYLISQNVDNLHLKSGIPSDVLAELHGNHALIKCLNCDARFSKQEIGWDELIHGKGYRTERPRSNQPKCPHCNGRIVSSVVNFNDPMPEKEMRDSDTHSRKCDVMLVVGSSLSVSPAADFPVIAKRSGATLIIVNMGATQLDGLADVRIEAKSGVFLPKVVAQIKELEGS
ncbi:Sir2 family NAD-dependent protein deacetylase [Candidatus Borrarchaeum sp.]|uniref:SIR2 family NAD-dependent protein deacylase n=1 Tax=Candidatus Borrarchaeum sp. TaxID=2846742 RepID=UPI00257FDBBC|nr:Sir2 family NAD-dependent protein deacetylase [Candidatus Borrarchaeum sp.]